jgi:hypothetical protein
VLQGEPEAAVRLQEVHEGQGDDDEQEDGVTRQKAIKVLERKASWLSGAIGQLVPGSMKREYMEDEFKAVSRAVVDLREQAEAARLVRDYLRDCALLDDDDRATVDRLLAWAGEVLDETDAPVAL